MFLKLVRLVAAILFALGMLGYLGPVLRERAYYCYGHTPPELHGVGEDVLGDFEQSFQVFPPGFVCRWQLPNGHEAVYRPTLVDGSLFFAAGWLFLALVAHMALRSQRGRSDDEAVSSGGRDG